MENINEAIEEITKDSDALKSSVALNRVLHQLLIESKRENFRLWIIIICLICVILGGVIGFFVYESQFDVTETQETSYTYSEASGQDSAINNVQGNQYNDSAIHKEG